MILPIQTAVRAAIADTLGRLYALEPAAIPTIVLELPPRRALGDLGCPVAFELARRLRKAPRAIAQETIAAIGAIDGVSRVEAAPNGYINVFLDRARVIRRLLETPAASRTAAPDPSRKTIVEHTAINPNKAAHIGHLRNSTLGDTLVRMLRFAGIPVEVQNYIDDTGVQVADVVVGFREIERKTLAAIRTIADTTRFDYYCWDLYSRVTEWYAADSTRLKIRSETLHAIEHGGNDTAEIAAFVADRIVRTHLKTMGRLNVDYDLLTWEGDILRLKFWARAFEILRDSGAMFLQNEGKLAGCWVMKIDEDAGPEAKPKPEAGPEAKPKPEADTAAKPKPEAGTPAKPTPAGTAAKPTPAAATEGRPAEGAATASDGEGDEAEDPEQREKVIVRSDGTVTYVGKDIAYQYWKFGLLGRDFHYRPFATRLAGNTLWATTSTPSDDDADPARPPFGRASAVYNVIDTRQAYLQKLLKQALATLGHARESERSTHFSYEMVALSHRTARELGYEGFDENKPFVEVSGRKGLGVKADDLLDRMIEKARTEVQARNPDMPGDVARRTAEMIGVAATRYFLVKFTRTKIIAFDIDEALSFEGESGPYLQYSVVRARNIFNKLDEREGLSEQVLVGRLAEVSTSPLDPGDDGDELWNLALEAARLDEVIEQAVRTLEPAVVAKYAFSLAQAFNAMYHKFPILAEERPEHRAWRAAIVSLFRQQLTRALDVMGAEVPSRM
jgi:arginyl-tRNA synthetase